MKRTIYLLFFVALWSCRPSTETGADNITRFEEEIVALEAKAAQKSSAGGIAFLGSSSIRMWSSLQQDFAGLPVVNLGFGGSTLPEVNHYLSRIISPYQPEVIVLYCGENDIAEGASPEEVFNSFRKFVDLVRRGQRTTRIIYVSMKPSPARWELWPKMQEANALIRSLADQFNHIQFVDISSYMLDGNGEPIKQLYLEDGLHMNSAGYGRWSSALNPVIERMY